MSVYVLVSSYMDTSYIRLGFPGGSVVKSLPAMQETRVWSLGWEDPLEEGMATYSSTLAWRLPMDRGAWRAAVHGVAQSDTTEGWVAAAATYWIRAHLPRPYFKFNYLPYLPKQSHSEILGVRTSRYKYWGNTVQPMISPKTIFLNSPNVLLLRFYF